jgi:D-glycero-D-manno-heptose 1,7-bisphosphate phosphatase
MPSFIKAVFLDRDGVIIVNKDFIIDAADMEFTPGAIEGLKRLNPTYKKIVISNQSGVGRGLFTTDQVDAFNAILLRELKKRGVLIDEIYYCPHSPDDNCDCRKPKTMLFEKARGSFGIDFAGSWMIGDKSSDIQAGKNIGARTILVGTGYGGNEPGADSVQPDYIVDDLFQAVEIINNES